VVSVEGLREIGDSELLFESYSYTQPGAWYRYNPETSQLKETRLVQTAPATFDDIQVTREFATSKDGTRIPMNILRLKGVERTGPVPTILYGYGGYGISQSPWFDIGLRLWFDQGGIYVVAAIRGGGEYGEEWHRGGNLLNKQNCNDDFIACAEYLIENQYTPSELLAIRGGSNGGLLMGAVTTQRPELFRAVASRAGVYDQLRTELEPNGEFNVTEYGTVKDPALFKVMYGYSPYHNVRDNTAYPAILMYTGEYDGRVNPWHSRKMIAALQAANRSEYPILMRTSETAGHGSGAGTSERADIEADVYAFLMDQLGMRFKPL
jgi:prolyl oligopeptidase